MIQPPAASQSQKHVAEMSLNLEEETGLNLEIRMLCICDAQPFRPHDLERTSPKQVLPAIMLAVPLRHALNKCVHVLFYSKRACSSCIDSLKLMLPFLPTNIPSPPSENTSPAVVRRVSTLVSWLNPALCMIHCCIYSQRKQHQTGHALIGILTLCSVFGAHRPFFILGRL